MESATAPLFSVITAVFNGQGKIGSTIASVLSQDPEWFEYIVIDGNSTDATLDEIQKAGDSIRWISEADRGVYDALNKGIRLARGQFLYFIGAGDTLRAGALQRIAGHIHQAGLETSAKPCLVYGDVFSEDMGKIYGGRTGKIKLGFLNICHQAIFYDRRIFDQLGGYDTKYRILADYHLNLRCYGANSIRKVRVPVVVANYETAGLSSAADHDFDAAHASLVREHLGLASLLVLKLRYRWLRLFSAFRQNQPDP